MIPDEQAVEIKKLLLEQIENTFPKESKPSAKEKIDSMDNEQLEVFLKENNLISQGNNEQKCIFCSIVFSDIPSHKISENLEAMAVLEINPVSRGHILIIPKKHISIPDGKTPEKISELSKEIEKRMKSVLKPKKILYEKNSLFGHDVINLIPVYKNESLKSKRYKADKKELEEILGRLSKEEETPKKEQKKSPESKSEKVRVPRRIP